MVNRSGRVLAWVLPLVAASWAWCAPSLVVAPSTFDLGRQPENKGEYPFTFTLKNAGDEELTIERVRPGCSCTKVELTKQTLAPGETTAMTGVLTTRGVEGLMRKGIIITSNDPVHQTTVASVQVRLGFNCQGARLTSPAIVTRWRDQALWGYVTVENCQPEASLKLVGAEVPEGWECTPPLPATVPPEERLSLVLKRVVPTGEEPAGFEGLGYAILTDAAVTPRLAGTLIYRPVTASGATPSVAAPVPAGPKVRWPMSRPVSPVSPVVAPVTGLGPVVLPAPARASGTGATTP